MLFRNAFIHSINILIVSWDQSLFWTLEFQQCAKIIFWRQILDSQQVSEKDNNHSVMLDVGIFYEENKVME